MIFSRARSAKLPPTRLEEERKNKSCSSLKNYLLKRDYIGAITYLEFKFRDQTIEEQNNPNLWKAYSYFHLGNYHSSIKIYLKLIENGSKVDNLKSNLACCYFYLGEYDKSKLILQDVLANNSLVTRLNFHLSHKLDDENALMEYHEKLQDILEDQLSLASLHYMRAHYQEAINIYKKLLQNHKDYWALNVYIALCYYKLDYYDASQEALAIYLKQNPDSIVSVNLKACNYFRLYNLSEAENCVKTLSETLNETYECYNDLVKHNLVVFRNGEEALKVFPSLVNIIPEARLNLAIFYLKRDNVKEAYELIKDMEAAIPQDYILKGIVHAAMGQEINSSDYLKLAEEYFHMVGDSESEKDTIPGRQCMASAYFLSGRFEEVLLYLTSIKSYFHSDDIFNYNYAQAKCMKGHYREAEEIFHLIKDENMKIDYVYNSHLARCYIMNEKPRLAWELYLKMENSPESFNLLLLIANDCYRMGAFWHATKAFDMLDRLEPVPEFWEGKRGAIVGVFQGIIAKRFSSDLLGDIMQLLKNSVSSQSDQIIAVIRSWAKENRKTIT